MSLRRALVGATLVAALVSCGSDESDVGPEPDYPLYAPALDGARIADTEVSAGAVRTRYERDGFAYATLTQSPAPSGDLCRALEQERMAGDTCRVEDGVMTTSMEEMSGVALVRDGTLLHLGSLVTEADPGLLERAITALRDAPETTLAQLAVR